MALSYHWSFVEWIRVAHPMYVFVVMLAGYLLVSSALKVYAMTFDFALGLFAMFFQPYRIGDEVHVIGSKKHGKIVQIGPFDVKLRKVRAHGMDSYYSVPYSRMHGNTIITRQPRVVVRPQ